MKTGQWEMKYPIRKSFNALIIISNHNIDTKSLKRDHINMDDGKVKMVVRFTFKDLNSCGSLLSKLAQVPEDSLGQR